jgi:hypothetical protein
LRSGECGLTPEVKNPQPATIHQPMKAPLVVSLVALVTSLAAGFLAIRAFGQPSEAEINRMVDARLAERELRFVGTYAPKFREMLVAVDDSEFGSDWNPKTLEELFAPLVKITSGMAPESE